MRRGTLTLSAGWVLCAAAWAACGGEQIVTRKDLGFQIAFPNKMLVNSSATDLIAYPSETSCWGGLQGIHARVSVIQLQEGESLRSLFTNPALRTHFDNAVLSDIRMIQFAGVSAIKLTLAYKLTVGSKEPDERYRSVLYYAVSKRRGYLLNLFGNKSDFDKQASDADAIVASFKIIEAK